MSFKERRRAPRVKANLDISISGGPHEAVGKTLNISSNGVLFEAPHRIDPLTKVRMGFMVPGREGSDNEKSSVSFDGVVVRVEPDKEDPDVSTYRIAVFFTHVSKASQKVLDSYIMNKLSS